MKHLLIVHHSQTGHTAAMASAVWQGTQDADVTGVESRCLRAVETDARALLWCQALLLGTPENFGYMSGGLKDFFDRTYYPLQGRVEGLPYALFVSAGNDGSGAVRAVRRIASGLGLREVQEPLIVVGPPTGADLATCAELGLGVAAGLEVGVF